MAVLRYLLMFFSFGYTQLPLSAPPDNIRILENWKLQREGDSIQVYSRWIDIGTEGEAREMRVEMEVDVSVETVVATIKNDGLSKKFVLRADVFYHFDFESPKVWYTYSRIDIPWPLTDQELITRNELFEKEGGAVEIVLTGVPDKLPLNDDYERIPYFAGSWIIVPRDESKTFIRYQLYSAKRISLPQWIIDPIVEAGLWKTFDELRKVLIAEGK